MIRQDIIYRGDGGYNVGTEKSFDDIMKELLQLIRTLTYNFDS